jgi:hypothetical protein
LERATTSLSVPDEPEDVKTETRALLEESPEEGGRVVEDTTFVAELLWEEWRADLEGSGMGYDRFLQVSRGYAAEFRLWVVGERPWNHCVAGLAGRLLRRLPAKEAAIPAEV